MPHLPHASTRRHVYKLSSHVSGEWQVTRVSYSQSVPVHTPPEYLPVPCSTPGRGMQTSCRTRLCLQNCNLQSTLCCRFQRWCVVTWAECDVWSLASHRISQSEGLSILTWVTNERIFYGRTILSNDLSILDRGHLAQPRHETWLLNIHRTLDWNSLHSCDKMIETWHWAHRRLDRVSTWQYPQSQQSLTLSAQSNSVVPDCPDHSEWQRKRFFVRKIFLFSDHCTLNICKCVQQMAVNESYNSIW